MYEHIHLHTHDYEPYVYSWVTTLGHTHYLVWWPQWPHVSLMSGQHPSPRQIINRLSHQSLVAGGTGMVWWRNDTYLNKKMHTHTSKYKVQGYKMCTISQISLHANVYAELKRVYDLLYWMHKETHTEAINKQMINVGPNDVTSTMLQCMLGRSQATLSSQQLEYQGFGVYAYRCNICVWEHYVLGVCVQSGVLADMSFIHQTTGHSGGEHSSTWPELQSDQHYNHAIHHTHIHWSHPLWNRCWCSQYGCAPWKRNNGNSNNSAEAEQQCLPMCQDSFSRFEREITNVALKASSISQWSAQ